MLCPLHKCRLRMALSISATATQIQMPDEHRDMVKTVDST